MISKPNQQRVDRRDTVSNKCWVGTLSRAGSYDSGEDPAASEGKESWRKQKLGWWKPPCMCLQLFPAPFVSFSAFKLLPRHCSVSPVSQQPVSSSVGKYSPVPPPAPRQFLSLSPVHVLLLLFIYLFPSFIEHNLDFYGLETAVMFW